MSNENVTASGIRRRKREDVREKRENIDLPCRQRGGGSLLDSRSQLIKINIKKSRWWWRRLWRVIARLLLPSTTRVNHAKSFESEERNHATT